MNPTTWHHPAARMAGRAGGAGNARRGGGQHGHRRHGDLRVLSPEPQNTKVSINRVRLHRAAGREREVAMRRLSFIGVCLTPVLLLLGTAGAPAIASTSVPVTIQSTVMIGPHTGTWSASGGISDAGTLVDVSDHLVGNGQIHVVRDVTGSLGTFTLRIDGSVTGVQPDGSIDFTDNWVVIAGTGGYAELRGQGTGSAVVAHGVVTETLTGSVHFD